MATGDPEKEAAIRSAPEFSVGSDTSVKSSSSNALPRVSPVPDYDRPRTWPLGKKIFHTALPALYGFSVTVGTSIYTAGVQQVSKEFHVSQEVALLGLSLFSEGLALGPMIAAPISEMAGRKAVYLITLPVYLLFTMGAGLAQNIGTLLACRFLAAVFGSPALAVGAGTVADVWEMEHGGGLATVIITTTFFLGPAIGPLIGGYTIETRAGSWRWLFWVSLLVAAPVWLLALLSSETSQKQIVKTHGKKHGTSTAASANATPQGSTPLPAPTPAAALKMLFVVTLFRPVRMLLLEPIVGAWALYHAFVFGVLYAFFDGYPYIYTSVYGASLGDVGLAFVGIFIGVLLAPVSFAIVEKTVYARKKREAADRGEARPSPEERLWVSMMGAFGVPASLFWVAWTARPGVSWWVPVFGGVPFGWGVVTLFLGGATYMLDTYGALYSASAMAANGLLRYTFGAAFPLFTTQMYENLGIPWATSLVGFVSIGLLPIPFVLYRFGPALRARSGYKVE